MSVLLPQSPRLEKTNGFFKAEGRNATRRNIEISAIVSIKIKIKEIPQLKSHV